MCYRICQSLGGGEALDKDKLDEELNIPVDSVGKSDELLKGADVSVSEDADRKDEDGSGSAEVVAERVVDGAPSLISGIKPERDTLGNATPRVVRPTVTPAGVSRDGGATGSERRVEVLVTAPEPSMKWTTDTVWTMTTWRSCSFSVGGERMCGVVPSGPCG